MNQRHPFGVKRIVPGPQRTRAKAEDDIVIQNLIQLLLIKNLFVTHKVLMKITLLLLILVKPKTL